MRSFREALFYQERKWNDSYVEFRFTLKKNTDSVDQAT